MQARIDAARQRFLSLAQQASQTPEQAIQVWEKWLSPVVEQMNPSAHASMAEALTAGDPATFSRQLADFANSQASKVTAELLPRAR